MLLALIFLCGAAPAAKDEPVTIGFELAASKHIVVPVKINGKGPYRLVFDTGAPVTTISSSISDDAGFQPVVKAKDGNEAIMGPQVVETFDVGGVAAKDVAAVVFDHPTVQALSQVDGDLDGIVGLTFWGRYRTVIDYKASTITLTPNGCAPGLVGVGGNKAPARRIVLGMTLEQDGPVVKDVLGDGAADAAGLKPGDRISMFDGRWIVTRQDVYDVVSVLPAGEKVPVTVSRGGREVSLSLETRRGF